MKQTDTKLAEVRYPLPQLNRSCVRCPDLVKSRKRVTFGYGNIYTNVMFVGEAPGYNGCDVTGIPFTRDPSGELFQQMLHEVGWTKESVYVTNIVKCCPPGNRTPTEKEVNNCSIYLEYEIARIYPTYIVLVGKPALQYFFPMKTKIIANWDKEFTHPNYPGIKFVVLPHSAYITRNRELREDYLNSFRKLKILTG